MHVWLDCHHYDRRRPDLTFTTDQYPFVRAQLTGGMLADQLELIAECLAVENCGCGEADQAVSGADQLPLRSQQIKAAWRSALFSGADDCSLGRYFSYQLAGITRFSDLGSGAESWLLELTQHLLDHYPNYLDQQLPASRAYQQHWAGQRQALTAVIRQRIQLATLSADLKNCLLTYLGQRDDETCRYTFSALRYEEILTFRLDQMLESSIPEQVVQELLLSLNFNHLSYYAYRQLAYQVHTSGYSPDQKLSYYKLELRMHQARPEPRDLCYDAGWPSLKNMLGQFLQEEIHYLTATDRPKADNAPPEKFLLNLSVAQLACLLRLLVEEDCFVDLHLQELFKFISVHFRTKKQQQISAQSLSKEYYSVSQVTAAVLRDKLSRMIARINRTFFPV